MSKLLDNQELIFLGIEEWNSKFKDNTEYTRMGTGFGQSDYWVDFETWSENYLNILDDDSFEKMRKKYFCILGDWFRCNVHYNKRPAANYWENNDLGLLAVILDKVKLTRQDLDQILKGKCTNNFLTKVLISFLTIDLDLLVDFALLTKDQEDWEQDALTSAFNFVLNFVESPTKEFYRDTLWNRVKTALFQEKSSLYE